MKPEPVRVAEWLEKTGFNIATVGELYSIHPNTIRKFIVNKGTVSVRSDTFEKLNLLISDVASVLEAGRKIVIPVMPINTAAQKQIWVELIGCSCETT